MPSDPQTVPAPTPYELLGGEPGLRRLVGRFYTLMNTLPEAWTIRQLHPASLAGSERKLFEFLSGWFGGPDLYIRKHGHPRLRARHLPFAIASRERDEWMLCMRMACEEVIADAALRARLLEALAGLADHMRNRRDQAPA